MTLSARLSSVHVSKTDSTSIEALSTKLTSNPNLSRTIAEHFLSHPNHCYTDMQLILLKLIHSSRDSLNQKNQRAGALEPHDMNRRDES